MKNKKSYQEQFETLVEPFCDKYCKFPFKCKTEEELEKACTDCQAQKLVEKLLKAEGVTDVNRTIKFRGVDKKSGAEIHYGTYYYNEKLKRGFIVTVEICQGNFISGVREVIPETVSQFTGKYDRKGEEIYENDLCRFFDDEGGCSDYKVMWNTEKCKFAVYWLGSCSKDETDEDDLDTFFAERCEIIHPERETKK